MNIRFYTHVNGVLSMREYYETKSGNLRILTSILMVLVDNPKHAFAARVFSGVLSILKSLSVAYPRIPDIGIHLDVLYEDRTLTVSKVSDLITLLENDVGTPKVKFYGSDCNYALQKLYDSLIYATEFDYARTLFLEHFATDESDTVLIDCGARFGAGAALIDRLMEVGLVPTERQAAEIEAKVCLSDFILRKFVEVHAPYPTMLSELRESDAELDIQLAAARSMYRAGLLRPDYVVLEPHIKSWPKFQESNPPVSFGVVELDSGYGVVTSTFGKCDIQPGDLVNLDSFEKRPPL